MEPGRPIKDVYRKVGIVNANFCSRNLPRRVDCHVIGLSVACRWDGARVAGCCLGPRITVGSVRTRKNNLLVAAQSDRKRGYVVRDCESCTFPQRKNRGLSMSGAWQQSRGCDDRMLIALAMTGESMAPGLYDGDTLVVNLADITPSDGEVFLLSDEGLVLVRRLIRDAGKWWLSADNSDQRRFRRKHYSRVECKIIGRVVYRSSERL